MTLESSAMKSRKRYYTGLGMILGAGLALFLSQLGLEVEMAVGMVLGMCIGTYIDKSKE